MEIVVVGPGRIGMAIAVSVRVAGHDVTILARPQSPSGNYARVKGFKVFTNAFQKDWQDTDLILFAVGVENSVKYPDLDTIKSVFNGILHQAKGVPLASVVGSMDLNTLRLVFGNRPLGRFLCSTAIGEPDALRFYDAGSHKEVVRLLENALPGSGWQSVPTDSFTRYGKLLTGAALVLFPLIKLAEKLSPLDEGEKEFLLSTLKEAQRLVDAHSSDPAAAFFDSVSPNGITQSLSEQIFHDIGNDKR